MSDARILCYDVETKPLLCYTWGTWKIDRVIEVVEDWCLLSVAWKWLGEKEIGCWALCDVPRAHPTDDKPLAVLLQQLFEEADIVLAHNGNTFDQPRARTRMIQHGLTPPSPVQEIDTLQIARRRFAFSGNTLNDLGRWLEVGQKEQTGGFGLWKKCMADDPAAWDKMKKYNKSDVKLLEDIYLKLRPWMETHPNVALIADTADGCPKCGSAALTKQGYRYYGVSKRQRYQCRECGGWSRSRELTKTNATTSN